jgi:CheY-like chemotaxis protein
LKVLVAHWHAQVCVETEQMIREKFVAKVETLDHGLEAIFRVQAEAFDLILCSIELPVVTGFEIVRTMRHYPANKYTPAIIMANTFDERHISLACQLKRCTMANTLTLMSTLTDVAMQPRKSSSSNTRFLPFQWSKSDTVQPISYFG